MSCAMTSVLLGDMLAATDEQERWDAFARYVDMHGWIDGFRDARSMGEGA